MTPYMRLYPWYGPGGHPECPEPDGQIAFGKDHDYRCYPRDGGFVAEERPKGGAWILLSEGHKNAYIAGTACAIAERNHTAPPEPIEPTADAVPEPQTMFARLLEEQPGAEILFVTGRDKKPSAVEALKARAASKRTTT